MSGCTRMNEAPAATSEDVFLGGRLSIEQPARGFRAGLDAVLLAASVPAVPDRPMTLLDVGAGVGTAGLCVATRLPAAQLTLLEIAPALARLARANVERNGLSSRVRVVEAGIAARPAVLAAQGLAPSAFDVVIANPPYLTQGRHSLPQDATAAASFGMADGGLEPWLRFMARTCRSGGSMVLIHRADALSEVLAAIGGRFGGLRVLPIHPRDGEPAHRILVLGRKGSRAALELLPGLVLHGAGNHFLPRIDAVLRNGAPLSAFDGGRSPPSGPPSSAG